MIGYWREDSRVAIEVDIFFYFRMA